MTSTSSPSTPGEGTAWTDADRDRVWPEGWIKCPFHPDQRGDVYHSANWHEDRTPAPGEGTRQRPGGWVPELGCWIAWLRDLDPMDLIWLGPVDPLTPAVDHQVPETYDDHVRVVRWADGTSPAPPAPLTRPDTAALRADAMNASAWVPLTGKALAVRLFAAADWIDAQPAPLTPTPQPDGRWVEAIWHILVTEGGANAEDRDAFIAQWPDCVEYRFGGHLGSGGKVWAPGSKRSVPVVDFYPESSTVSRRAIAARINVHLCDAYVMAIALGSAAPPPTPVERPAAITDEMLRAAETHHGDSCSYCTSTGDIDCPTAAVLDALAAATSPGDNP